MNGTETPTALSLLRKSLTRALKHLYRKLQKQQQEFRETENAGWYRQIADSLLAKVATPQQRGCSHAPLFNIHTQKEENVALNPRFDFRENAALYYKKARKGERGKEINIQKISATESEIKKFEQLIHEVDEEPASAEEVSALSARIVSALKLPKSGGTNNAVSGTDRTEKIPYRHLTVDEWNIYIGKNDAQNDEMTTRFAKPHDLWLHVAGHAGSHVVVRRPDRTASVPQGVISKAASLAAWFSKAKHTSYAEVHYTEARFVRKRRHAPAGEVIVDRCKSIRVSPRSPEDLFPSKYEDRRE
ncbi:MAG: NFACT RNA binding domain-containing protein [Chitinispirillaceae bacterium]|jgi:predicted ribosome quality control (RQC) complex YloA/Tae2 family protein